MNNIGVSDLVLKNINEIDVIVNTFIKSSLDIRNNIIKGMKPELSIRSLLRDTYMCNLMNRYIGMMTLLSLDPMWETLDNRMEEYIQTYFNYNGFKNKLQTILNYYKKTDNKDYCKFLEKMIDKCNNTKEIIQIKKQIRMRENKIFNLININPTIKLSSDILSKIPENVNIIDNKMEIPLSYENYYNLINNICDIKMRHTIENQFMSRTKNTINEFSKLILHRHQLANKYGYDTYFNYINRNKYNNTESIKSLISELNNKIDKKTYEEIDKIHNFYTRINNTKEKISISDIINYNYIHKNSNKYHPSHVFSVLCKIFKNYFNLTLIKCNIATWNKKVIVYNVIDTDTKHTFGRLYIDIIYREDKKISDLISINLSDKMEINIGSCTLSEVAVIANYPDEKCMTYSDIILFFKEFGYVINNICYNTRVGLLNYDNEFSNYVPLLMEYISYDIDTISMVCNNDNTVIDHIKMDRYLDLCINLKIKCVNAKFDYILHNSKELVDAINSSMNEKKHTTLISDIYINIYKDLFASISDIMINNIMYINPLTIVCEINNSQGILYSNLMNEIFAYATYWLIKEKNITNFRSSVLENGIDNYRDLIRGFLNKTSINYFDLYIKNIIKTKYIEDYITEETNCFDDKQSDSENDKEDIITITRI